MKRKKCVMLIPLAHNDGSEVQPDDLMLVFEWLGDVSPEGHTVAGTVKGCYRMADGTKVTDESLQVWIVVDPNRLDELRKVASRICGLLGQETLYFEVTESDVEFIPPTLFDEGNGHEQNN